MSPLCAVWKNWTSESEFLPAPPAITTIEELLALKEGMEAGDVIHFRLWRSGGYLERDVTLMEQYVP